MLSTLARRLFGEVFLTYIWKIHHNWQPEVAPRAYDETTHKKPKKCVTLPIDVLTLKYEYRCKKRKSCGLIAVMEINFTTSARDNRYLFW